MSSVLLIRHFVAGEKATDCLAGSDRIVRHALPCRHCHFVTLPVIRPLLMTNANGWVIWAILSAVFAALTAIFAKIGLQGVNPDLATLIRTLVVVVLLAAFVWFTGQWSNPFSLSVKTLLFLVLSALATGASWVCYFRALQFGEASKVAPVDKFSVVLVAIIAFAFLGERPSAREWSGIALVSLGVLVLAFRR